MTPRGRILGAGIAGPKAGDLIGLWSLAIQQNLKVMDATALTLCRDQKLPINVFSIFKRGALQRVVAGEDEGTLVHI